MGIPQLTLAVFLATALSSLRQSQAIKCWVCDGKTNLKECHGQYGQMQECSQPDHVCQNDYRTVRGKPLIIKGCKQAQACATEVKQNKNSNQCGRTNLKKNLVCRCCCSTSGCNSKESGCLPPPAPCKKIAHIKNGRAHCPHGEIKFRSQCSFACNNGFQLVGKRIVTCRPLSKRSKKGKWVPEEFPFCEKIIVRCDPPREVPENGFVSCTNSKEYAEFEGFNYAGSSCKYSCKKNYYVEGKKIVQCRMDRTWSNPSPKCLIGRCQQAKADENRIDDCTNKNLFGSSCTFTCKDGFTLIGHKRSACAQLGDGKEGMWSKRIPRCAKVICQPEFTTLHNGKVECTDQNFKGSACTFTCNIGYDMDGSTKNIKRLTCDDDGNGDINGEWTGQPPTCSAMACKPAYSNPQNGGVTCSDKNNFGSECTFVCDEGYDLDNTEELAINSTCQDDNDGDSLATWSANKAPTCSPIVCKPAATPPSNGHVRCTNRGYLGSACSYECNDDYDLTGTDKLVAMRTCNAGNKGSVQGQWSGADIECKPILCPQLPWFENGMRICSMGLTPYSGSFCLMWCSDGYEMIGISYITCRNTKRDGDTVGDWNEPPAICELSMCEPPKYDASTVVRKCTAPEGYAVSEYRVGTACEYKCINDGYYMVPNAGDETVMAGFIEDTCTTERKWSNRPPRCFKKTCLPPVTTITNGHTPKCSDGNTFGTRCKFQCLAKHGLTHNNPLICESDGDNDKYGKWSDTMPRCERNECDEFGTINNGRLNCSNGVMVGSVCDLFCIDRYIQKRYKTTTCLPTAKWDRERYVCCVKCLFNKRTNILTLFDSTSFATKKDWQFMVDFVEKAINLMISYGFDVQLGAYRYAEDIDEDSALEKTRLRTKEALAEVKIQLREMPITGRLSNIGKALTYANEVFFAKKDRRREEFIILVTAGNSNDEVVEQAKAIRNRGINIFVVGFKVNQSARKTLLDIAGVEKNLLSATTSDDLSKLSEEISVTLMTTGCTAASRSQPCS